ncbi:MAG: twin-arginine translocase TatA/TatE family subunit [Bacteroidetes bacterium]|nr:twin-arginine translocase TatA/TatE family subunit [Bacteroidota bacterium]
MENVIICGSIGFQEILVILLVVFLVFGPKKIPEMMRTVGKGIRQIKKALNTDEINQVRKDISGLDFEKNKENNKNERKDP